MTFHNHTTAEIMNRYTSYILVKNFTLKTFAVVNLASRSDHFTSGVSTPDSIDLEVGCSSESVSTKWRINTCVPCRESNSSRPARSYFTV